MVAEVV